jgi:hypothetical protein
LQKSSKVIFYNSTHNCKYNRIDQLKIGILTRSLSRKALTVLAVRESFNENNVLRACELSAGLLTVADTSFFGGNNAFETMSYELRNCQRGFFATPGRAPNSNLKRAFAALDQAGLDFDHLLPPDFHLMRPACLS